MEESQEAWLGQYPIPVSRAACCQSYIKFVHRRILIVNVAKSLGNVD